MEDINIIYHNDYGIAFHWKRGLGKDAKKIQLVFRDTGLFFTKKELSQFYYHIQKSLENPGLCEKCKEVGDCRAILLETPMSQISFAVSYTELKNIEDLVNGTLFKLGLDKILQQQSINKI
jgi:hypothetical protein